MRLSAKEIWPRLRDAVRSRPGLASALLVAMMSLSLWVRGAAYIDEVSSTLVGIRQLVAADSEHYLDIADDFRSGDFSMSFVAPGGGEAADRAHRQPAYPAVLAAAEAAGISGAPALAKVNLLFVVATLWIAFGVGTWICGSALSGALAAGIVYQAHFLFDIATERLLSEPLYVLIAMATVGAALAYLERKSFAALLLLSALAGLAYLTRVNGLFLAGALMIVIIGSDLRALRAAAAAAPDQDPEGLPHSEPGPAQRSLLPDADDDDDDDDEDDEDRPLLPMLKYGAAVLLFLVVASPSWVSRLVYAGNPVYHGYLTNYLWVDDYDKAHVPGPPRYSWSTYWADHSIADAAHRLGHGISRVYWETPRDKIGEGASIVTVLALVTLLAARKEVAGWLLLAAVLQTLPLAWTALPNSTRRVPAAALLPFFAILSAQAAALWMQKARVGSDPASAPAAAIEPGNEHHTLEHDVPAQPDPR